MCIYVCIYLCTYICMYRRIYVYIYIYTDSRRGPSLPMCIYVYIYFYVYTYICTYVKIQGEGRIHPRVYTYCRVCFHVRCRGVCSVLNGLYKMATALTILCCSVCCSVCCRVCCHVRCSVCCGVYVYTYKNICTYIQIHEEGQVYRCVYMYLHTCVRIHVHFYRFTERAEFTHHAKQFFVRLISPQDYKALDDSARFRWMKHNQSVRSTLQHTATHCNNTLQHTIVPLMIARDFDG